MLLWVGICLRIKSIVYLERYIPIRYGYQVAGSEQVVRYRSTPPTGNSFEIQFEHRISRSRPTDDLRYLSNWMDGNHPQEGGQGWFRRTKYVFEERLLVSNSNTNDLTILKNRYEQPSSPWTSLWWPEKIFLEVAAAATPRHKRKHKKGRIYISI